MDYQPDNDNEDLRSFYFESQIEELLESEDEDFEGKVEISFGVTSKEMVVSETVVDTVVDTIVDTTSKIVKESKSDRNRRLNKKRKEKKQKARLEELKAEETEATEAIEETEATEATEVIVDGSTRAPTSSAKLSKYIKIYQKKIEKFLNLLKENSKKTEDSVQTDASGDTKTLLSKEEVKKLKNSIKTYKFKIETFSSILEERQK